MRTIGLLLAVLVGVSGQSPSPSPTPTPLRELQYQFGFNTKAASSGQGTGTTTVDIYGLAGDGGVIISGTDFWWNTVRPRATNTCEIYPTGGINCAQAPNAISPIQLSIFPLLAKDYFNGLNAAGTSSWKQTYTVTAAILAGSANPFASTAYTWNWVSNLQGKGPIPNATNFILIEANGTFDQQGGRFRQGTFKTSIAYDPVAKIPVIVDDLRTHLPQTNVYNNDLVSLKLLKDSLAKP